MTGRSCEPTSRTDLPRSPAAPRADSLFSFFSMFELRQVSGSFQPVSLLKDTAALSLPDFCFFLSRQTPTSCPAGRPSPKREPVYGLIPALGGTESSIFSSALCAERRAQPRLPADVSSWGSESLESRC